MVKKYYKKIYLFLKRKFDEKGGVIDKGSVYVVVILTLLIFGGFIFVGGTLPTKLPKASTELVTIVTQPLEPTQSGLQLHTFYGITPTLAPTRPPVPTMSQSEPHLIDCGRKTIGPSRPEMIWGFTFDESPASGNELALKVFYASRNALLLGSGGISIMTSNPSSFISNLTFGNLGLRDPDNFPIYPAVFLTDTTIIETDISGDAQLGGQPQRPTNIFGTWKAQGAPDPPQNGQIIGSGADLLPGANGPPGNHDLTYSSEIVWKATALNAIDPGTHEYSPLKPGRKYRAQIALHDGATPGNVGVACVQITMPGSANIPAPTQAPESNPTQAPNTANPTQAPNSTNPTQTPNTANPTQAPNSTQAPQSNPTASAPVALNTYIGYMDGLLFIRTENINRSDALSNCQENANANQGHKYRCTWGAEEIYNK